jgi:hypothetical protein
MQLTSGMAGSSGSSGGGASAGGASGGSSSVGASVAAGAQAAAKRAINTNNVAAYRKCFLILSSIGIGIES